LAPSRNDTKGQRLKSAHPASRSMQVPRVAPGFRAVVDRQVFHVQPALDGVRIPLKEGVQLLGQAGDHGRVSRVVKAVHVFARVGAQVKELIGAVRIAPDELVTAVPDHAHISVFADLDTLPVRQRCIVGEEGREAAAGIVADLAEAGVEVHPGQVEDGLEKVGVVHELNPPLCTKARTRVADQHRYPDGFLDHVQRQGAVALAPDAMVAAVQPVIGGVNDEGVLQQPKRFQLVKDLANAFINLGDGGVILSTGFVGVKAGVEG